MEKYQLDFTPLSFEINSCYKVQKQRKIFQFYAKQDQEKLRKNKAELFSLQNIEGLATVLSLSQGMLQFVYVDQFITEITLFFQGAKKHNLNIGERIRLEQGNFLVLIDGYLVKKSQNSIRVIVQMLNNNGLIGKNKRNSTRDSPTKSRQSTSTPSLLPTKTLGAKKFVTDSKNLPKLITYDPLDTKPFSCLNQVVCLQFTQLSLQKLQNWINIKERQLLINFFSSCFNGFDDRKTISKLVSKLKCQKIENKSTISIDSDTAYLIYKGTILLQCESYQIQLSKNSLIYRSSQTQLFKAVSMSQPLVFFTIHLSEIFESSQSKDSTKEIENRLKILHSERKMLFEKKDSEVTSQQQIEPIFSTDILKIKLFQKSRYEQKNTKSRRNILLKPKPRSQQSKRLRIGKPVQQQCTLPSDLTVFLSNYPYVKIVESEEKAGNILKMAASLQYRGPKSAVQRQTSETQKKKIEKQIKKLYYNDKVRRLKIRNIAQKQIPNGHRKKLDGSKAEKQISEYLLFKNMIEYPMNGISQDASKQARNTKIVEKIVKMSSVNINSSKYGDYLQKSESNFNFTSTDRFCIQNSLPEITQSSSQIKDSVRITQQRCTTLENECLKSLNGPLMSSFYCKNLLTPHLKSQKEAKIKKSKPLPFSELTSLKQYENNQIKLGEKKPRGSSPVDKMLKKLSKNCAEITSRMRTII